MDPAWPTAGNAAGNTENLLDVTDAPAPPAPLPDGFRPKGIVAMTFSILAGLLGVGVIAWYGMGEMGAVERQRETAKIAKIAAEAGVATRTNTDAGYDPQDNQGQGVSAAHGQNGYTEPPAGQRDRISTVPAS